LLPSEIAITVDVHLYFIGLISLEAIAILFYSFLRWYAENETEVLIVAA